MSILFRLGRSRFLFFFCFVFFFVCGRKRFQILGKSVGKKTQNKTNKRDLFFFSFSFFDSARGSRVEVRRWTRKSLARLRSTPEDSQPFTSLMVSQSAYLYLRDSWICLVESVFPMPWGFL